MAGNPELDQALTAQEVFESTFGSADAMVDRLDGLRTADGRGVTPSGAHERDIPRTNLLLVPFSNFDKQTGAEVASSHVRRAEGLNWPPVLSISNVFRGYGDEGSPLAVGVYRAAERAPDYVLWQKPDSDLIIASIGSAGLRSVEELPEEEVVGSTEVKKGLTVGDMEPEDRSRLSIVVSAIQGRVAMLERVTEALGDDTVEKVEYTGADTGPELIYPSED